MNTWSVRVKSRMKELGMTQETLSRKMGITRGAVTHYLAGRRVPPLNQFQKMASILKTNPAWLQYGVSEDSTPQKKVVAKNEKIVLAQIPILSWEQVAEFIDIPKITKDEIKAFLPNIFTDQSHWYALRIAGDAMTAPLNQNKSFHENDIIIIDSNLTATHGSFVVALLPRSREATFKQYVVDGGIRYLKPLNPQYPITKIDDSTHICGVVVRCINNCTSPL